MAHYHEFRRARQSLPAEQQAKFEARCVAEGRILASRAEGLRQVGAFGDILAEFTEDTEVESAAQGFRERAKQHKATKKAAKKKVNKKKTP